MSRLLRGRLVSFDAAEGPPAHVEDGGLLIRDGRIAAMGDWADVAVPGMAVEDWRPRLILPGFVDPHIHFPQTHAQAAYGGQLLDWLNGHIFPAEQRFADPAHAAAVAPRFLDETLRHGTTTVCAFGSVHAASVEALFTEAERRNLRLLAGKVLMDRNAPDGLRDDPETGAAETAALIARWHGRGRLGYAIAPRFAITSTPAQLAAAGALAAAHPGCLIQTHLSENRAEIDATLALYPQARDYTDVYARFGLLTPRSLMGHCIHLSARERAAMAEAGAVAVFCPTSNLFLGSGLFDLTATRAAGVRVAVATDVGAGTAWGMPATLGAAHGIGQLLGAPLHPFDAFRLATAGNAAALGLGAVIGRLAPGYEADLVVLDPRATPAMALRATAAESLADELFVVQTLGDDRAVAAVYVAGEPARPLD